MTWTVRQTRRFARAYKKLHLNLLQAVDQAVAEIAEDPDRGERKRGDLAELWVYRFRCQEQAYLLGYTRDDGIHLIYLEALGSRENSYREPKR
ncbi:type II toxin-antitoxin system RelE/ParE family toxin [Halorhodospira neutriphila]|uniref:Addiction module toxin RelE n=1 Tax=Halorhodospira neutriphila TaxID=168379 RepID=A0ABS1E2T4_9GAMM|nr:addiction module toxin RelE [Halorhodospira neutriphila]